MAPEKSIGYDDQPEFFLLPERRVSFDFSGEKTEASLRCGGKGPLLLAIPGLWNCGLAFRHLVEALSARFFLEIAEPPTADCASISSVEDLAGWLAGLCEALKLEKALWLAQGESALSAMLLALQRPGLFSGLVAIAPPCQLAWRAKLRGKLLESPRRLKAWAERASTRPFAEAGAMLDYADPTAQSRLEIRTLARRWETLPEARNTARSLAASLRPQFAAKFKQLVQERLADPQPFCVPLYLLAGAEDSRSKIEGTHLLLRAFPGTQFRLVEDAGAQLAAERPQAVIEAVLALASA